MGIYIRRNILAMNWLKEKGIAEADIEKILAYNENAFGMGDVNYTPEQMLKAVQNCVASIETSGELILD